MKKKINFITLLLHIEIYKVYIKIQKKLSILFFAFYFRVYCKPLPCLLIITSQLWYALTIHKTRVNTSKCITELGFPNVWKILNYVLPNFLWFKGYLLKIKKSLIYICLHHKDGKPLQEISSQGYRPFFFFFNIV